MSDRFPSLLPEKIGRFEVHALLGEGGFGRVYKAFDPNVGRMVAVKVMNTQSSEDMLARFQNEATSAGNFQHENIVTIYESGVHNGLPFIVMEYLQGVDLNVVLAQRGPLSLLESVRIMTQVGQGLQCAHEAGVVHRDVKPANIKVQPNGVVKIMDFGIARLTRADNTRLTQDGTLIGTVRYMSPEQFAGREVDHLCDVFAYGVIYYEVLSGKHPFEARDVPSFIYRITEGNPLPLGDLVPGCPPVLAGIVMRAFEKSRDLRYQSLQDLLLDTRPILLDLQKERAAELLEQVRDQFDAGQIAKAQAGIREVIELDSSNRDAWALRDQIQKLAHRRTVRPRVETLLAAAERDLASRLYQEAIESLEAAGKLDPTDTEISQRLTAARQQWDGARQAARLVSDATRERERQNLTIAERMASRALELDRDNSIAADLLGSIHREIAQRDNERRLKLGLDGARRLAAVEDYDAATEMLLGLQDIIDSRGEIGALLSRIRDQKVEKARQERLRSEKQVLRGILKEQRFQDALPRLENLCKEFPEDQDLATLLADTAQQVHLFHRSEAIRQAMAEVAPMRSERRFEEAEAVLRRLSDSYPGDSEIFSLWQDAQREREDYEQQQRAAEAARRQEEIRLEKARAARQLLNQGKPGESVSLLSEARKVYPDDPELAGLLAEARQALADRDRERDRNLRRAKGLLAMSAIDEATELLDRISVENPGHAEVAELTLEAKRQQAERTRRKKLEEAAAFARGLIKRRAFHEAIGTLEKFLRDFPDEKELIELLQGAKDQLAAEERSAKIEQIIQRARSLAKDQDFAGSANLLRDGLQAHPDNALLARDLETVLAAKTQRERRRALVDGLARCRHLQSHGAMAQAAALAEALAKEHPESTEAAALRDELQSAAAENEALAMIESACDELARLLSERNFEGAENRLARARIECRPDPRLDALERKLNLELWLKERLETARTHFGKHQHDRADRVLLEVLERDPHNSEALGLRAAIARLRDVYAQGRDEAERLVAERNFDSAIDRYQSLLKQFPGDPVLEEALYNATAARERYRRRTKAAGGRTEAINLLRDRQFDRAIAALETLTREFPEDVGLADDLRTAVAAKAESRRRELYASGRAQAEQLVKARSFDEALRKYQALLQDFPGDAVLEQGLAFVKSEKSAEERRLALSQGRAEASRLSRERKFDAAILKLRKLMAEFPQEASLEEDLRSVMAAKELQEQRRNIDHLIAELEKKFRKGDAKAVKEKATSVLAEMEDPRVRQLLEWAEATLAKTQNLPTALPVAPPPKRISTRTVLVLACLPVLALAAYSGWKYFGGGDRGALTVSPQQMTFAWKQGTSPPEPRKIQVQASGYSSDWTFSTSDTWLKASRAEDPRSEVALSVEPLNLNPGSYSGLLVISYGRLTRNVAVKLSVEATSTSITVPEQTATLSVVPEQVAFVWKLGAPALAAQSVYVITSNSTSPLAFNAPSWLRVTRVAGRERSELSLSILTANLKVGSHSGVLTISADGVTKSVRVKLTVEPADVNVTKIDKIDPPPILTDVAPITDQPVDCQSASYGGRLAGSVTFTGDLPPNELVSLGRTRTTFRGRGSWRGEPLPGCEILIPNPPSGIRIEEWPNSANRFSLMRVKNVSSSPVTSFTLRWEVKPKP